MHRSRSGFTLIEMLIVVAIIAILAGAVLVGLGPVQKGARDSRRISDLRQTQNALELYYNKMGAYPNAGVTSWATLESSISAQTAVKKLPYDPNASQNYMYASDGSTYVIGAQLEAAPSADSTKNSWTGTLPSGASSFGSHPCGLDGTIFTYCLSL